MSETVNNQADSINTLSDSMNPVPGGINTATDDPTPTTPDATGLFPSAHKELQEALGKIHADMLADNASVIERMTELRQQRKAALDAGVERYRRETDELMRAVWGK